LIGQSAGTEKCNPAKVTDCHDDGTAGAGSEARATTRGERVKVLTIRRASGPAAVTSMPMEGA
jgi:hypothetical protein